MFVILCLALLCAGMKEKPVECAEYEEGTDIFYTCTTGEDLDLSLLIQDEADTVLATERN